MTSTTAPRRLLGFAAALGAAALAGASFVLTYDDLRELAIAGDAPSRYASWYPWMYDGLVVVAVLAVIVARSAGWFARTIRQLLLVALIVGGGYVSVQNAIEGYERWPDRWMSGGVAVAPWAILLLGVWLCLTMFRHIRCALAARSTVDAGPEEPLIPGMRAEAHVTPVAEPAPVVYAAPAEPPPVEYAAPAEPPPVEYAAPAEPPPDAAPYDEPRAWSAGTASLPTDELVASYPRDEGAAEEAAPPHPDDEFRLPGEDAGQPDEASSELPFFRDDDTDDPYEAEVYPEPAEAQPDQVDAQPDQEADIDRPEDPDAGSTEIGKHAKPGSEPTQVEESVFSDVERWGEEAAEEARRWAADIAGRFGESLHDVDQPDADPSPGTDEPDPDQPATNQPGNSAAEPGETDRTPPASTFRSSPTPPRRAK